MSEATRKYRDAYGNEFDPDEEVPIKELAVRLGCTPWFIYAMRQGGFSTFMNRASYNAARNWLIEYEVKRGQRFSAKRQYAFKNRAKS